MIQDILDQQPDIISFQEPRQAQVNDLAAGLQDVYNCTQMTVWAGGDVSLLFRHQLPPLLSLLIHVGMTAKVLTWSVLCAFSLLCQMLATCWNR